LKGSATQKSETYYRVS